MESGADFIKTSTGKMNPAATPEAALEMCLAIRDFYRKTGRKVGFKPAGGISTTEDAILYLTIVNEILGEDWLNPSLFRIGASRLANNLLSNLLDDEVKYF
jgi:deoxyribose-phosphate aldolase